MVFIYIISTFAAFYYAVLGDGKKRFVNPLLIFVTEGAGIFILSQMDKYAEYRVEYEWMLVSLTFLTFVSIIIGIFAHWKYTPDLSVSTAESRQTATPKVKITPEELAAQQALRRKNDQRMAMAKAENNYIRKQDCTLPPDLFSVKDLKEWMNANEAATRINGMATTSMQNEVIGINLFDQTRSFVAVLSAFSQKNSMVPEGVMEYIRPRLHQLEEEKQQDHTSKLAWIINDNQWTNAEYLLRWWKTEEESAVFPLYEWVSRHLKKKRANGHFVCQLLASEWVQNHRDYGKIHQLLRGYEKWKRYSLLFVGPMPTDDEHCPELEWLEDIVQSRNYEKHSWQIQPLMENLYIQIKAGGSPHRMHCLTALQNMVLSRQMSAIMYKQSRV